MELSVNAGIFLSGFSNLSIVEKAKVNCFLVVSILKVLLFFFHYIVPFTVSTINKCTQYVTSVFGDK